MERNMPYPAAHAMTHSDASHDPSHPIVSSALKAIFLSFIPHLAM
jgi:hypothetical protein